MGPRAPISPTSRFDRNWRHHTQDWAGTGCVRRARLSCGATCHVRARTLVWRSLRSYARCFLGEVGPEVVEEQGEVVDAVGAVDRGTVRAACGGDERFGC